MDTLDGYLTKAEADAEREYGRAYHSGDRERLLFWSELAHWAGKSARALALAAAVPTVE